MEQFITDDIEEIEETEQEESASFIIDNDQKADWAVRKIMETENAAKMWKEYYKKQSDRVEQTTQQRIAYFTALLESYFDTVPHKATKTSEKYKLPSGVLVRKAQAPEYERDDAQIIAWCTENAPSCVENVPKLKWTALKGLFVENNGQAIDEITGEVVPGIKIVPRDPVFAVQKG
jgi:hypothetical protein